MEGTTLQSSTLHNTTPHIPGLAFHHNHFRGISDYHLQEFAKYCCELEQLDILGTNKVTMEGVST